MMLVTVPGKNLNSPQTKEDRHEQVCFNFGLSEVMNFLKSIDSHSCVAIPVSTHILTHASSRF